MGKQWLVTGVAAAVAALSGCASAPVSSPPPLSSAPLEDAGAGPTPPDSTSSASDAATQEVVVYGSVPQPSTSPTVPCGLASLAWTLNSPADAWRILAPVLPNEQVDTCMQNMGSDSPVPARLRD